MENNGNNIKQCKYYSSETIQGIIHSFCKNPKMLETNNCQSDKIVCIGSGYGNAFYQKGAKKTPTSHNKR